MNNFAADIEQALDLTPHTVVITDQPYYWAKTDYSDGDHRAVHPIHMGVPLPWNEARVLLDYNYDDGHGGQDCHDVYVYSDTEVAQVHEYDGATWVITTPLVPTACAVPPV